MKAYLLVAGLAALAPAGPGEIFVLYPKVGNVGAHHLTALGFFEGDLSGGETCDSLDGVRRKHKNEYVCWLYLCRAEIKFGGWADVDAEVERLKYFLDLRTLFQAEPRLAKVADDCLPPRAESPTPDVSRCKYLQARLHVKFEKAGACDVSGMSYGAFFPIRYQYLRSEVHSQDLAAGLEFRLDYDLSYVPVSITSLDAEARTISFKLRPRAGKKVVELIVNNFPVQSHLLDGRMFDLHSRAVLDLSEQCVSGNCPLWGERPFGAGSPPLVTGVKHDCVSSFARSSSLVERSFSRLPFPFNIVDYSHRHVVLNDDHATPIGVMDGLMGPPICPKAVFTLESVER